ncbi:hypothetical protein DL764_004903 [Monosporascus ibericus]|uniref:Uncharacterized protein n=1 Tax=Monosporascus ibericus TaxID=155417 RepID=A0A4Q4TAY3_9PEZI|nr:hypothetical protein DL764_004903 [Monosporascus ibericus]
MSGAQLMNGRDEIAATTANLDKDGFSQVGRIERVTWLRAWRGAAEEPTIQGLSVFAARFGAVDPKDGSFAICNQGRKVITRILDKVLSPPHAGDRGYPSHPAPGPKAVPPLNDVLHALAPPDSEPLDPFLLEGGNEASRPSRNTLSPTFPTPRALMSSALTRTGAVSSSPSSPLFFFSPLYRSVALLGPVVHGYELAVTETVASGEVRLLRDLGLAAEAGGDDLLGVRGEGEALRRVGRLVPSM